MVILFFQHSNVLDMSSLCAYNHNILKTHGIIISLYH